MSSNSVPQDRDAQSARKKSRGTHGYSTAISLMLFAGKEVLDGLRGPRTDLLKMRVTDALNSLGALRSTWLHPLLANDAKLLIEANLTPRTLEDVALEVTQGLELLLRDRASQSNTKVVRLTIVNDPLDSRLMRHESHPKKQAEHPPSSPVSVDDFETANLPKLAAITPELTAFHHEVSAFEAETSSRLQKYLDSLQGSSFGSLEANQSFAQELRRLLGRLDRALECQYCKEPAVLTCNRSTSPDGAFRFRHTRAGSGRPDVGHGGTARIPRLQLTSALVPRNRKSL